MRQNTWIFAPNQKRWEITATFETQTPLHVGNGDILDEENNKKENVNAFIKGCNNTPIIPGSTIKGKLRSFLEDQSDISEDLINQIFGETAKDENNQGQGGIAEFYDTFMTKVAEQGETYPDWEEERGTYIEASTAINRHTQTAKDGSLHYTECVPPKAQFTLIIRGDMTDKQAALLLSTLHALADQKITIGAEDSNNKGLMKIINLPEVKYLDYQAIKDWLANKPNDMVKNHMLEMDDKAINDMQIQYTFSTPTSQESFDINLNFATPFIVNDPSKTGEKGEPDQQPLTDANGNPILPAKSFRGAIRSQAERIIRTLGGKCCDTSKPCKDTIHRCIACELFGSTGWKSQIKVSNFTYHNNNNTAATSSTQQFVAIDRFHGGSKDSALFCTEYFDRPTLNGKIIYVPRKLQDETTGDWKKGLLALLFRDLKEGDITFGFGENKGFGKLENAIIDSESFTDEDLQAFRNEVISRSERYNCDTPKTPDNITKNHLADINPTVNGNHFHNPYHFIPIADPNTDKWTETDRTHKQAIKAESHHSHAFYRQQSDDGTALYHGKIQCKLTTESPMFIAKGDLDNNQQEEGQATLKEHFMIDNQPAIPSTTLRGMISSLAEAASNSAMREFDVDATLSYRKKASPEEALNTLGIIIKDENNNLKLLPTTTLGAGQAILLKNAYTNNTMKTFIKNNNSWLPDSDNDKIYYLDSEDIQTDNRRRWTDIPPTSLEGFGRIAGILRILGKFGDRVDNMTKKEHEYFIPIPNDTEEFLSLIKNKQSLAKSLTDGAKNKFEELVMERIQSQKAKRNRNELTADNCLPYLPKGDKRALEGAVKLQHGDIVYYREENNKITEVSFSAIWRDKVKDELKTFIPENSLLPFNSDREKISPAELLFGFIEKNTEHGLAFAGKVQISAGTLSESYQSQEDIQDEEVMLKELSSPKLPSPALYFKPKTGQGYITKSQLNSQEHQIQGRKLYLHAMKNGNHIQKLAKDGTTANNNTAKFPWETRHTDDSSTKRKVRINPIKTGISFDFDVEFNNLTKWELGLLCYALRPEENFRHKIGMGKPIGLGTVKIDITQLQTIDRKKRYAGDKLEDERINQINWQHTQEEETELTPEKSKEQFIDTMEADIYQAIRVLGNPDNVKYPVHYPQVINEDIEEKSYQWFVANDTGSGPKYNKLEPIEKSLEGINALTPEISPLKHYAWNENE